MDVRKSDGERYTATSLYCLRYSLIRYLEAPSYRKTIDIVNKDASFANSRENFKAAIAELKMMGLGDVKHYPAINETNRKKYSLYLSPKIPLGLQNKVQFDIRFYFCSRGNENMPQMHKSTFMVKKDSKTGLKYTMKTIVELTKNHRADDKEKTSAIMPENPGSEFCHVLSYEQYVSKLNPSCEKLWQRPKDEFYDDDQIWYNNVPVGEKTLGSFMLVLSKKCDLSQTYTNHSIRATGATILAKNSYCHSQIMAITGHKSVASLALYQRVDGDDKIRMGQTSTRSITNETANTSTKALPAPNIIPIEDGTTQEFTEKVQSRSDMYKCSKDYRAKTIPFSGVLSCTAFKPKHVGQNEKGMEAQGFNECSQGVDLYELFAEFTETSIVKHSVNQQQMFNNCSVTKMD